MNKITFPLNRRSEGQPVGDLQAALVALLSKGAILPDSVGDRRGLVMALRKEVAQHIYGDATANVVKTLQMERRLQPSGEVDSATAEAVNNLLRELRLLDEERPAAFRLVTGVIGDEHEAPLPGVTVRAEHVTGAAPIQLGEARTDAQGRYNIRYDALPGVDSISLRISAFDEGGRLLVSSDVVPDSKPVETINLTVPAAAADANRETIEGTIVFDNGIPAENLKLRLYRRIFGGETVLMGETETAAAGRYTFSYDGSVRATGVEVRAVQADGPEISLCKPLNDLTADLRAALNLVAPSSLQPLAAEYRRLAADLTPQIGDMAKLANARENDQQQDLSLLNRTTNWDARLLALASVSEKLAADPAVGMAPEALYGLLRAGLPSDKQLLAQVEPDTVDMAIKKARDSGIVEMSDEAIADLKTKFTNFATATRLGMSVPGSSSTYGAMLKASGLAQDAQDKFAPVFLKYAGNGGDLWEEALKAGLDGKQIGTLQLQGKLAFLAGSSEKMTAQLMSKGLKSPADLASQGFHNADEWKNELIKLLPADQQANPTDENLKALESVVPPTYAGESIRDRIDAYAEDMARKIRLSYPTHVLAHLMENDERYKVPDGHDVITKLLKDATTKGFRLGETPVSKFLQSGNGVGEDLSPADLNTATEQLKTLQRTYQITPCNEAMPVLMRLGIKSAFDVTAYSEDQFIPLFKDAYLKMWNQPAPRGVPELINNKSKQVSSVTYNLFAIARKLESEPAVLAISGTPAQHAAAKAALKGALKSYPTMESLFGSMDYCECEHCRSVLSPAAYLVDLLQFVDMESQAWDGFLTAWSATHDGQRYPYRDASDREMKPYDVLITRRPDLPHIALTCENTQTALPYIDIVNEILEYYVANNKLAQEAAHDTGDATSAELLAEPQYVIREAYDQLRAAHYPLNLPFDLWLETTRKFCDYFDTPFHQLLDVTREDGAPFDRRVAIFMESLGLAAAEVEMFADGNPLPKWYELYGFAAEADATTEATDDTTGQRKDLNSAKALSRRLGVTYKEITDIVQTGFVNPELGKLGILYKLGVNVRDARLYNDEKAFYEANKDLLGADRTKLTAANQQRFDALADKRPNRELTGWQVLDEVQAFGQKLDDLAAAFTPPLNVSDLQKEIQGIPFDRVLVLADPDTGCNFDETILRYANGTQADPIVFLRINFFVRLWRKMGWSVEEIDRSLTTFVPQSAPFDKDAANLAKQPLRTALVYFAHLNELDGKVKVGKQSRLKLLTLWSNIPTTGKKPLYAQLFLNRSVLKTSQVFDHPLGQYLSDATIKLKDHTLALQGGLGLTVDEITQILSDAGQSIDTAQLSLGNVSLLYRYGLLAKALKLSVQELIALRQLSGFDSFKALAPDPLTTLAQDNPLSQTLEFVNVAAEVKDSGLDIEDLKYLLQHRFDETGPYRSNEDATLSLLKTFSEGVRAIRVEHAVPANADALSDEVLRQKLGLALGPDVVERFMGMVNTTADFTATSIGIDKENAFDQLLETARKLADDGNAAAARIRDARYTEVPNKEQKLTVQGVVLDPAKTALKDAFDASLNAAQKQTLADLLDELQGIARDFFESQLKKQTLRVEGQAGFLDEADFATLFAPLEPFKQILPADTPEEVKNKQADNETIDAKNHNELVSRRRRIGQAFLPFLQERLIRDLIVQTLTSQTGADPGLVESLVTDDRLLAAPKALLGNFAATAVRGLDTTFWLSADATTGVQPTVLSSEADTGARDATGTPLKPAGANSALLDAYIEVPAAGAYRFYIQLEKKGATAELRFPHRPEPVLVTGTADAANATLGDKPDEYLELKAGVLYRMSLKLTNLDSGNARLIVQGETLPRGPLSQLVVYPATAMESGERSFTLLTKALQLVQSLGLSEREIRYVLMHAADFDNVSLSELPTAAVGDAPPDRAASAQRFGRFRRLASYARLKRDLAGGTDDLIGVFEATGTDDADRLKKQVPLIAAITRRDEATVQSTAEILVKAPAVAVFASEKPLVRLWSALQLVELFGVSPASLSACVDLVDSATTETRRFELARDVKEAIKARFEPETWQRVAQPIFDSLRARQRDGLVAYVLQQMAKNTELAGIDTRERLYEYFLIDPGMEPVVQTSRIRLAIASLQLFIQRCLLNLEPKVNPSAIKADQWEWMKRYRVWEANRKIFLYPENWLEPEFRDDKTHLFSELEGALLQGDVSSDLVEDAFFNYLKKLDQIARLDICAMHVDDGDPAHRVLHVFGRTFNQPFKYFYRRYADEMWTPWEPVSAEVEGEHLAPVVWRDRLYLFWVTFAEKGHKRTGDTTINDPSSGITIPAPKKDVEAQLHWSEYVAGEWTTRESGDFRAPSPVVATELTEFDPKEVFVHVTKEYDQGEERGVYIHLDQSYSLTTDDIDSSWFQDDVMSLFSGSSGAMRFYTFKHAPGPFHCAFYLVGRNSAPERGAYADKPQNPFTSATAKVSSRYSGSGALTVSFREKITSGDSASSPPVLHDVLANGQAYTLLPCNSDLAPLKTTQDDYSSASDPKAVQAAVESGLAEIATLMRPVFYQDRRNNFFVEPDVNEKTTEEWHDWLVRAPVVEQRWRDPEWWKLIDIKQVIPRNRLLPVNGDPFIVSPASRINPAVDRDWLINPGSVIRFGDTIIGPAGLPGIEIRPSTNIGAATEPVAASRAGDLASGSAIVVSDADSFARSGLLDTAGGLNVVGAGGFNSALESNMNGLTRSGLALRAPRTGGMNR